MRSELHPDAAKNFNERDSAELKISGKTDQLGRTTARYFEYEGTRFSLENEKYRALAALAHRGL